MVALQSRINGELGLALGDGSTAALFSFSSGLVVLSVALALSPKAREGLGQVRAEIRAGHLPWWAITGGVGGGFLVLTQGISAGILGVALFTIAVVTGQTVGAVVIDSRGWFGTPLLALTWWRIAGALITLTGAMIALDPASGSLDGVGVVFLLPLLAGLGTGYQQAVNGRVKRLAGSALTATFLNFSVGTLFLAVVTLIALPVTGGPDALPETWWLWTGGIMGTVFIAIQVTTVGTIGVLGLGVSVVTGQLLGSLLLDSFLPVASSQIQWATVLGALITLVGSLLVAVRGRG
jgi:transporter family-2 protein